MSMRAKLAPLITSVITSRALVKTRRRIADARRIAGGRAHDVHFFHQPDDPYSHLAAQCLSDLQSRYDIRLHVHLVAPPADEDAPEREALEAFSRRDAAAIAPHYGVRFTDTGRQPSDSTHSAARRALAASSNRIGVIVEIGEALWADDTQTLERMPLVSAPKADDEFAEGTALRATLGHYLGAMFHYGGEWYWGIDRLPYLEARLSQAKLRLSGCQPVSAFRTRPAFMAAPARRRVRVEFFPSLRSPYSYLAMSEVLDLPNHYPVDLVHRPVLPMVMRGLPVPRHKGRYIMGDAKREADRIGVPFGRVADPVGTPVLRGASMFPYADAQGKGGEYLHEFCKMAWSEGIDLSREANLKKLVGRAGLDWDEAAELLDTEDWKDVFEANRLQIMESGLWGVPSFRLLDDAGNELFSVWGRDRIWLLAHEIQKALAD